MIYKAAFTNDDLDMDYQLLVTHNLGTSDIVPAWKDDSGKYRIIGDLIQVIDDNNVMLSCNEPITGTHYLYLSYEGSGTTTEGRRAFELSTTEDPADTMRLIMGKLSTPAVNMTISAFLTWIYGKLGFLKTTNNLSDLENKGSARSNLSVYSQAQVDSALGMKATLYQSGSGSVLGVNNTSVYNPSSKYNPATLRNVNNVGLTLLLIGRVARDASSAFEYYRNTNVLSGGFSATRLATGKYQITHNYNANDSQYMVVANSVDDAYPTIKVGAIEKYANYFIINLADDAYRNDGYFEFMLFAINSYQPNE